MFTKISAFLIIAFLTAINPTSLFAVPITQTNPDNLEDNLNSGEIREYVLNVSNGGDEELTLRIEQENIEPERDSGQRSVNSASDLRRTGPSRDEFGEIITEYQVEQAMWSGLAWDGELMWGINNSTNTLVAFDLQQQRIVERANLGAPHNGLTYDGENFWSCRNNFQARMAYVVQIDREGNEIALFDVPGNYASGVTFDGENLWFYSSERFVMNVFRNVTFEGELIREIDCNGILENNNAPLLSIEWVPEHEGGNLWVLEGMNGVIFQLDIENGDPELVSQMNLAQRQCIGIEHDGTNLWYSCLGSIWYEMDDGIIELGSWLSYEPEDVSLDAGEEIEINITFDASIYLEGDYEAILHLISNDPDNPDVEIPVAMHVNGNPELEVAWSEIVGWPENIDWNSGFEDLFSGQPYEISITVQNVGTAALEVQNILCDNEVFTVNPTQFIVDPGAEAQVQITLNAANDGIHESVLAIVWNSPEGQNFSIQLLGETSSIPIINIDPIEVEDELTCGSMSVLSFNIANDGESDLSFTTGFQRISEPNNDNPHRAVRNINCEERPLRDDVTRGFLGEYFLGTNFEELHISQHDEFIDFSWGLFGPLENNLPDDNWSIRWSGKFMAEESGTYTFLTSSDDGHRLFIDHELVADSWGQRGPQYRTAEIHLNRGIHRIVFEMCETEASSFAQLQWQTPEMGGPALMTAFTGYDWISINPEIGIVRPDEVLEMEITLNAVGLLDGDYEADLVIYSNDPETPEVTVNIFLTVIDGSDIEVHWQEEAGWPEALDWNLVYFDLFDDTSYNLNVNIENAGPSNLEITDVFTDSDFFTIQVGELFLGPGEICELDITFRSGEDETGLFEGVLSILSDDPDEGEIAINMRAIATNPPEILVSSEAIEEQMEIDIIEEHIITIFNDGGAPLRYEILEEIIEEPDRDDSQRHVRTSKNEHSNIPLRDGFGDELDHFEVEAGAVTGLARDGQVMWAIDSERQQMFSYDLDNQEILETFELQNRCFGLAYDGQLFWTGVYEVNTPGRIAQLDRQGNVIMSFSIGDFNVLGVGLDEEGIWICCYKLADRTTYIKHYTVGGDVIREIACEEVIPFAYGSLTVVPEHEEGPLWYVNWSTNELSQIITNQNEIEFIQQTQLQQATSFGICHDGENLWVSTSEDIWYVIDDGYREPTWFSYQPTSGEIGIEDETDIVVTIDGTYCILGDYAADLHIVSNDPNNPEIVIGITISVTEELSAPKENKTPVTYYLNNCYPNPFNSTTRITYGLPDADFVKIRVFDITGQTVATLHNGIQTSGHHTAVWKAGSAAAGIYFIRLESQDFNAIQHVTLLK